MNTVEEHEMKWKKRCALNKIFYYMCEEEKEHPGSVFEVMMLESMYIDLLKNDGICYKSHVTHFADLLISKHGDLEKRLLSKKLTIYFKRTGDALMGDALEPSSFVSCLHNVVLPLRKVMSSKVNKFDGTFDEDSQIKSIPIQLYTLISMLIDGPSVSSRISQASLTVSQNILSSFKQRS